MKIYSKEHNEVLLETLGELPQIRKWGSNNPKSDSSLQTRILTQSIPINWEQVINTFQQNEYFNSLKTDQQLCIL